MARKKISKNNANIAPKRRVQPVSLIKYLWMDSSRQQIVRLRLNRPDGLILFRLGPAETPCAKNSCRWILRPSGHPGCAIVAQESMAGEGPCRQAGVRRDRQLMGASFQAADQKRRRDQPSNAEDCEAVSAICCTAARELFKLPGFPLVKGMVYWSDYVIWRQSDGQLKPRSSSSHESPDRSRQILEDMR